jgi:biotin synthase-related radical SAM superfamily protein
METISWNDRVKNKEVLPKVDEGSVSLTTNIRRANGIGHSLHRNFCLQHVVEGKMGRRIEVTGRRGRRREQRLDDLKEKRMLEIERAGTFSLHCVENSR